MDLNNGKHGKIMRGPLHSNTLWRFACVCVSLLFHLPLKFY